MDVVVWEWVVVRMVGDVRRIFWVEKLEVVMLGEGVEVRFVVSVCVVVNELDGCVESDGDGMLWVRNGKIVGVVVEVWREGRCR